MAKLIKNQMIDDEMAKDKIGQDEVAKGLMIKGQYGKRTKWRMVERIKDQMLEDTVV